MRNKKFHAGGTSQAQSLFSKYRARKGHQLFPRSKERMKTAKTTISTATLCVAALACGNFTVHATGFTLGDASNYAVLYEGNGGNTLNYNNSLLTGNIGIGLTGKAQLNGPGTITGNIAFSAANTGQYSDSGVTVTGGVSYGIPTVTSALNTVNALSQTLGAEAAAASAAGPNTTINGGGSVNVASGFSDVYGNKVFNVTGVSFPNGSFTIHGDGIHNVVFDIDLAVSFNGSIVLDGLTSDQVLFYINGGKYKTLSGGPTFTIRTSGPPTTGTLLHPKCDYQNNQNVLGWRLFW